MKEARWRQLESLYNQALEMDETKRTAFLREACGGDEDLKRDLEELFAEKPHASFLEKAAMRGIAREFAETASSSWVGRQIGNYEFLSLAGAGGMGEVYRAHDAKLKRDVAIKVLPAAFSRDPGRISRFQREAQLLASLNHPNIAAIYGLEEDHGIHFLILELVEGDTLADRIRRGPIPIEDALKIALQIAEALEAAHEKNIVHRDIKPANIKVTAGGKVKVLDFGLAKALLDDAGVDPSNSPTLSLAATQQGVILGTASYMSPEQARGQTVDRRADVWAFGCVLFEMLTGRGTFGGKTVSDILASVLKTAPDWASLPANLPPRILHLLERCLEKDPQDRSQGLADARVEIRKALADMDGVMARPPTEKPRLRSRLRWVTSITALAVIAATLVWYFKLSTPATPAEFSFYMPEGQTLGDLQTSTLAISRDGTRLAYVVGNGKQLNIGDPTAMASSHPVPGAQGRLAMGQPVFSPDAQSLAFIDVGPNAMASLMKIPSNGGKAVTLIGDSRVPLRNVSWPTDDMILFASDEGILKINVTDGKSTVLIKAKDGETLGSPKLLPGGQSLMFSAAAATPPPGVNRWNSARIFVQSLKSDKRTLVWEGGGDPRYVTTGHVVYAQGSTLYALPFDIDGLKNKGEPTPIAEGVHRGRGGTETGNYGISDTGTLVYVPETAIPPPDGVLARVDNSGGEPERLKKIQPGQYRNPRLSPDGLQLAMEVLGKDGLTRIGVYEMSGDSEIRLLPQAGSKNSSHPIWRDNKTVTFASDRDGTGKIYSQRADGSDEPVFLPITAPPGKHPLPESWSPNGRTLSFRLDWQIWTFSVDTNQSKFFWATPNSQTFGSVFSPDGIWIAYTDFSGVYVRNILTGSTFKAGEPGETGVLWPRQNELLFKQADAGPIVQLAAVDIASNGTSFITLSRKTLRFGNILTYMYSRDYDTRDGKQFVMIVPADVSATKPQRAPERIQIILHWISRLK